MRVMVDAGHGGHDPGAIFRGMAEKDIVLNIAQRVQEECKVPEIEIRLTRDTDVFIPLYDRCKQANGWGADIFISVHCNADADEDVPGMPEARGEEIWYYEGSTRGLLLAQTFAPFVDMFFPLEPFRGLKASKTLCVLKRTTMPAILLEVGFIDRSETSNQLRDPAVRQDIAKLIIMGCDDWRIRHHVAKKA